MNPPIQLDPPPRDALNLWGLFLFGCFIGLAIAGAAWLALWPEPVAVAARPVVVERQWTVHVKGSTDAKRLICKEEGRP